MAVSAAYVMQNSDLSDHPSNSKMSTFLRLSKKKSLRWCRAHAEHVRDLGHHATQCAPPKTRALERQSMKPNLWTPGTNKLLQGIFANGMDSPSQSETKGRAICLKPVQEALVALTQTRNLAQPESLKGS